MTCTFYFHSYYHGIDENYNEVDTDDYHDYNEEETELLNHQHTNPEHDQQVGHPTKLHPVFQFINGIFSRLRDRQFDLGFLGGNTPASKYFH